MISDLTFHAVDEGDTVQRDLHPISVGPGSISDEAKTKVLHKITWFFEMAKRFDVKVCSVTYGRGLMWLSDQSFRESDKVKKWKDLAGGDLLLTPDLQHAMADAFDAGIKAMLAATET